MSVSTIQGTGNIQQIYAASQAAYQAQAPASTAPQDQQQNSVAAASDQVRVSTNSTTLKNLETVKAIEQLHNEMSSQIKGVRTTNEAINSAAEQISQMSSNLEKIVKNFPPFPPDSKERQELLMSYSAIRQEIVKMSFPPPPAPIYAQVRSTWDSLIGQGNQLLPTAVPALEKNSSDQQVQGALQQTQTTSTGLAELSSATTQSLLKS